MAKNIDFMGATFPDVPSIRLPQHEGGLVSFDDTSDGDIIASDVAQGKIGYAKGQKIVGTAVPSIPTIEALSVTENGTYTAPSGVDGYSPVTVNVSGGGALTKKTIDAKTNSDTEMVFTGLVAEPKVFIMCHYQGFTTYSSMPKYIICMDWIGNQGNQALTMQSSGSNIKYSTNAIVRFGTVRATAEYDNGTLTITITDTTLGQFRPNENYRLAYLY